jgi:chemosensory pili system protein ChpB (putative protein-glutamate methylesterase)
MADQAPRVVVLGRPGEAQQQLQHALDELGAQTLAVGDFDQLDPVQMREQQPDVWLVSMDETTDATRLERWQPLFDDPDATVIFDDADVTRRLSGWDLARWARHLAAKVLGRNDVLPPVSPDAERLPRSSKAEGDTGLHTLDGASADSFAIDSSEQNSVLPMQLDSVEYDVTSAQTDEAELSAIDDADFAALSASFDSEREQQEVDSEAHPPAMSLDDLLREQPDVAAETVEADHGEAASNAPPPTATTADALSDLSLVGMDVDLSTPRTARVVAAPEVGIDVSHLELAPIDDGTAVEPAAEPRITAAAQPAVVQTPASPHSHLSLEGAAPVHGGLIAIIAGLGGPDAVRQFLGALPATLPVPVLLWQHLDAGKHDRLAQQLSKASKLPVYLAQSGEIARPGAVGVMGTGMGVISDSGWWIEAGSGSATQGLAAALKDPCTVVAILSGAEPAIVEPASALSANGGKVLVQTSATCFDGTAASALESQGVTAGSPAELASLAASGWAS